MRATNELGKRSANQISDKGLIFKYLRNSFMGISVSFSFISLVLCG